MEPFQYRDERRRGQVAADTVVHLVAAVVPQAQEQQDGGQDVVEGAPLDGQLQEKGESRLLVSHRDLAQSLRAGSNQVTEVKVWNLT